jgi:azurin
MKMMMKMKNIILGSILSLFLIACGGEAEKKEDSKITIGGSNTEATQSEAKEAAAEEVNGVIELSLEGNDQMKFNKKRLRAKAGAEVELTFKHVGEMSKQAMGHNFVLLKKGTDIMVFAGKAVDEMDNDYIPEDASDIIVHTEMLGGGESTVLKFTAPTEKGEYDFVCSFPGHVALMKGKFIVN